MAELGVPDVVRPISGGGKLPERDLTVSIDAHVQELVVLERLLETLMSMSPARTDKVNRVILAVSEAVCNVVRHGYANSGVGRVVVRMQMTDLDLKVTLMDQAPPTPESVVSALCNGPVAMPSVSASAIEELPQSGWGVSLITNAAHAIEYERRDDKNHLILNFHL